jgi:hypothetical protein
MYFGCLKTKSALWIVGDPEITFERAETQYIKGVAVLGLKPTIDSLRLPPEPPNCQAI